jgi:hypothetical protein
MKVRLQSSRAGMGSWFLILFALPFAGVGVFMSGLTVRTLAEAHRMSTWPETPARILDSRLEDHQGDDSTTWKATARYEYFVGGQRYEGTRVGLHGGSDNIGSWQRDTADLLQRRREAGEPLPCRYDPADPAVSILFPQVRGSMLWFNAMFALVFGGAGFGLLIGSVRARRQQRLAEARLAEAPDEPWRARADWASGVIRSGNRMAALVITGFALFWNAISWTVVPGLWSQIRREGPGIWFGLLFPAIGLLLLGWAIRLWLVVRRYGGAELTLAGTPGVLGGRLAGAIRLPRAAEGAESYRLTLRCIEVDRRGEHTSERVRWEEEQVLRADALPARDEGIIVPVLFGPPHDLPASQAPCPGGQVVWRLKAQAQRPGLDLDLDFEVPVFRTAESRPDFQLDRAPLKAYLAPQATSQRMREEGVRVEEEADRHVYEFPPAQAKGTAVMVTVVAAAFCGISSFLWQQPGVPRFMAVLFSCFAVLVVLGALDAWFGRARVEADADGLRWRQFGLTGRRRGELAAAEVRDIAAELWGTSNNQSLYNLRVYTTAGRRFTIGRTLRSKAAADLLAADLKKALRIPAV